ncbi:MAG: hypothetical protein KBG15_07670 [Kofleriaceae bacterium]|nr:hypothetical protein [Kofleriaceae bacterium]
MSRIVHWPFLVSLLASATMLFTLGACGPIEYVNRVTQHASEAVDVAQANKANELSPYWWTRATLYLHKAREEAAHAGFAAANRFGRIAGEAAERASEEAAGRKAAPKSLAAGANTASVNSTGAAQ